MDFSDGINSSSAVIAQDQKQSLEMKKGHALLQGFCPSLARPFGRVLQFSLARSGRGMSSSSNFLPA